MKIIFIFIILLGSSLGISRELYPNRIFVNTREFREFRRIYIQMPRSDQRQDIVQPIAQFDQMGRFSIMINIGDTAKYLGSKKIKDPGSHPIEMSISFRDSTGLLLTGVTDKFYTVNTYYSFGSHRYIFDIFWKKPVETAFREKSLSGDYPGFSQMKMVDVNPRQSGNAVQNGVKRFFSSNSRIWVSVLLAFGFFSIMAVIILLVMLRRSRYSLETQEKNSNAVKSDVRQKPVNAKSKEDEIWELADKKGLSYDEAAIVVNISREEDNGKIDQ
ncbi:MAG: hypothetical protein J7L22_03285 [Candidatus Marinimicrobia bacterium]|nr:hypothetical protein [Candidatus Neomarinimicrobiota bacterium]RKY62157.1 MAG: hypothetical protein DRP96_01075 [Candidatus Neomarinimicrobiota bacterium]